MPKFKDITGQRFGRLVAIRPTGKRDGRFVWLFKCDCGKFFTTEPRGLRKGKNNSCGCRRTNYRHGHTPKHEPHHPLYQTWSNMRNRCDNPNNDQYKHYGGRGIKYDPRWNDFTTFLVDIGERPHPGLTLDRINNNGNYEPRNMRWATDKEQNANRRPMNEWHRKRRRLDQFSTAELEAELLRRAFHSD